VIVLLAGTNNIGKTVPLAGPDAKAADITRGIEAIVHTLQTKAPSATIIVTGISPRNDNLEAMPIIDRVNGNLSRLADGGKVRFLNINGKLADATGKLFDGMANSTDQLHFELKGYQVWADALRPQLTELLGAPAQADHAPPPTGDPKTATARRP